MVRNEDRIAELERLFGKELTWDDDQDIKILPNGEIVAVDANVDSGNFKPLTFRENLGGEYAVA